MCTLKLLLDTISKHKITVLYFWLIKKSFTQIYRQSLSLSLIFVLPLVWMIVSSLKPEADLFKDMSSIAAFFVSNPSLDNYKEMLSRSLVLKSTLNSMIYIVLILLYKDSLQIHQ